MSEASEWLRQMQADRPTLNLYATDSQEAGLRGVSGVVAEMIGSPRPVRRCAECGKVIPQGKLAITVSVTTSAAARMWDTFAGPLCSIACGAVAAVRLLEGVNG